MKTMSYRNKTNAQKKTIKKKDLKSNSKYD